MQSKHLVSLLVLHPLFNHCWTFFLNFCTSFMLQPAVRLVPEHTSNQNSISKNFFPRLVENIYIAYLLPGLRSFSLLSHIFPSPKFCLLLLLSFVCYHFSFCLLLCATFPLCLSLSFFLYATKLLFLSVSLFFFLSVTTLLFLPVYLWPFSTHHCHAVHFGPDKLQIRAPS